MASLSLSFIYLLLYRGRRLGMTGSGLSSGKDSDCNRPSKEHVPVFFSAFICLESFRHCIFQQESFVAAG